MRVLNRKTVLMGITLGISVLIWAPWRILAVRPSHNARPPFDLGDTRFSHGQTEARVHFQVDGNVPVVVAEMAGIRTQCIIDTGWDGIAWPAELKLQGQNLKLQTVPYSPAGRKGISKWVRLSSVRIGNYELLNVPSACIYASGPKGEMHRTEMKPIRTPRAILGTTAFANTALVFDYERREVIIRRAPTTRNTENLPSGKGVIVLPFRWIKEEGDVVGRPAIAGFVYNLPAWFSVDSGFDNVAISETLYERNKHKHIEKAVLLSSPTGDAAARGISDLSAVIGHIHFSGRAVVTRRLSTEAVLGASFLKHFRTTIDFPNRLVILEPRSK